MLRTAAHTLVSLGEMVTDNTEATADSNSKHQDEIPPSQAPFTYIGLFSDPPNACTGGQHLKTALRHKVTGPGPGCTSASCIQRKKAVEAEGGILDARTCAHHVLKRYSSFTTSSRKYDQGMGWHPVRGQGGSSIPAQDKPQWSDTSTLATDDK